MYYGSFLSFSLFETLPTIRDQTWLVFRCLWMLNITANKNLRFWMDNAKLETISDESES
jgi:hypothetical protein